MNLLFTLSSVWCWNNKFLNTCFTPVVTCLPHVINTHKSMNYVQHFKPSNKIRHNLFVQWIHPFRRFRSFRTEHILFSVYSYLYLVGAQKIDKTNSFANCMNKFCSCILFVSLSVGYVSHKKYLQTFESGSWFTCCFNVEWVTWKENELKVV